MRVGRPRLEGTKASLSQATSFGPGQPLNTERRDDLGAFRGRDFRCASCGCCADWQCAASAGHASRLQRYGRCRAVRGCGLEQDQSDSDRGLVIQQRVILAVDIIFLVQFDQELSRLCQLQCALDGSRSRCAGGGHHQSGGVLEAGLSRAGWRGRAAADTRPRAPAGLPSRLGPRQHNRRSDCEAAAQQIAR